MITATGVDRLDATTFARDRQRPIMAPPIACELADPNATAPAAARKHNNAEEH